MPGAPDVFAAARSRDAAARRHALAARQFASADYHRFGFDYFDNPDIGIGYGGYAYDGRYGDAAAALMRHYGLGRGSRVLEIGCAKGYVLVEFALRGAEVSGIDASAYAASQAHPAVRDRIYVGDAAALPFDDASFDLVLAKEVLPHVPAGRLNAALAECARVSRGAIFLVVQCAETPEEAAAIMDWDPTHQVVRPAAWWRDRVAAHAPGADLHTKRLFAPAAA